MLGQSDNSSSNLCRGDHVWIYAGDPQSGIPWEGMLCSCGMMAYHKEVCSKCSQDVIKPIPVNKGVEAEPMFGTHLREAKVIIEDWLK